MQGERNISITVSSDFNGNKSLQDFITFMLYTRKGKYISSAVSRNIKYSGKVAPKCSRIEGPHKQAWQGWKSQQQKAEGSHRTSSWSEMLSEIIQPFFALCVSVWAEDSTGCRVGLLTGIRMKKKKNKKSGRLLVTNTEAPRHDTH